jgi:hypothetical protein
MFTVTLMARSVFSIASSALSAISLMPRYPGLGRKIDSNRMKIAIMNICIKMEAIRAREIMISQICKVRSIEVYPPAARHRAM